MLAILLVVFAALAGSAARVAPSDLIDFAVIGNSDPVAHFAWEPEAVSGGAAVPKSAAIVLVTVVVVDPTVSVVVTAVMAEKTVVTSGLGFADQVQFVEG